MKRLRRFREVVLVALTALLRNRMRSVLATLGIVIGISSVIVIVGIGEGAQELVQEQILKMGARRITLSPYNKALSGSRETAGSSRLTMEDLNAILAECPAVLCSTPSVNITVPTVARNKNWNTDIRGVSVEFQQVREWKTVQGRFFTEEESRQAANVAVICHTVMVQLFGDDDPIGAIIRIKNMPFKVIGVLATKGTSPNGGDIDDDIFAPYTTVMRKMERTTYISNIQVEARSVDAVDACKAQMETVMRRRHHLGPTDRPDFQMQSQTDVRQTMDKTYSTMRTFLVSIASIALMVGGVGIMNIMLVSVSERIREIGIRLAVGARPGDILWQFLAEALLLSLIGGLLGIGTGVGASYVIVRELRWPMVISADAMIIAALFSAAIGVVFGLYPAWRASRLDPIQALRQE